MHGETVKFKSVSYSVSIGARFSKEHYLWNVPRLCPFTLLVKTTCSVSQTVFREQLSSAARFSKEHCLGMFPCSGGVFLLVKAVCRSEFLKTGFRGTSVW